jgi:hypothetical protein
MEIDYPLDSEPATPEYVFDVLSSLFGKLQHPCKSMPNGVLELSTPIDDWCMSWHLDSGWQTARWLEKWWGITIPRAAWKSLLNKPLEHTVGDLCVMLARYVRRRTFRPAVVFGRTCDAAGVFLAVRTILSQAGAEAKGIAPSTSLASYTTRFNKAFQGEIVRLAPQHLPRPEVIRNSFVCGLEKFVLRSFICCLLSMLLALAIPLHPMPALVAAMAFMVFILIAGLVAVMCDEAMPESVTFGDLRTFRDLAKCLAGEKAALASPTPTSRDR